MGYSGYAMLDSGVLLPVSGPEGHPATELFLVSPTGESRKLVEQGSVRKFVVHIARNVLEKRWREAEWVFDERRGGYVQWLADAGRMGHQVQKHESEAIETQETGSHGQSWLRLEGGKLPEKSKELVTYTTAGKIGDRGNHEEQTVYQPERVCQPLSDYQEMSDGPHPGTLYQLQRTLSVTEPAEWFRGAPVDVHHAPSASASASTSAGQHQRSGTRLDAKLQRRGEVQWLFTRPFGRKSKERANVEFSRESSTTKEEPPEGRHSITSFLRDSSPTPATVQFYQEPACGKNADYIMLILRGKTVAIPAGNLYQATDSALFRILRATYETNRGFFARYISFKRLHRVRVAEYPLGGSLFDADVNAPYDTLLRGIKDPDFHKDQEDKKDVLEWIRDLQVARFNGRERKRVAFELVESWSSGRVVVTVAVIVMLAVLAVVFWCVFGPGTDTTRYVAGFLLGILVVVLGATVVGTIMGLSACL
jgi:hypothetical protein